MAYKGIDVSAHNGIINWKKVKEAGIQFVMMRLGYSTVTDKKFVEYYKEAKAIGLPIGGYWFSYALNVSGAIQEADACAKLIQSYPLDLPVYFDFEDDTERYANQNGVYYTPALRTSIHQAFLTRLKERGIPCGIYANQNYLGNLLNWDALKSYPLWLASWPGYSTGRATGFTIDPNTVPTKHGKPQCWQFTDSGRVAGLSGKVDLDYWYDTLPVKTKVYPKSYSANGLNYRKCDMFLIVYYDAKKVGANYLNYSNAGFFSPGKTYTLPVANLVCEPWSIPIEGRAEAMKHLSNGKLRFATSDKHTDQFWGKKVSTLVVPGAGKPYIGEMSEPPLDCKYAISGIPIIRNGKAITQTEAMTQGWDASPFYTAMRTCVGLRNGEIWLIQGKDSFAGFQSKIKAEGFNDALALDGGGSAYYKDGSTVRRTLENRRVNNLIVFE